MQNTVNSVAVFLIKFVHLKVTDWLWHSIKGASKFYTNWTSVSCVFHRLVKMKFHWYKMRSWFPYRAILISYSSLPAQAISHCHPIQLKWNNCYTINWTKHLNRFHVFISHHTKSMDISRHNKTFDWWANQSIHGFRITIA